MRRTSVVATTGASARPAAAPAMPSSPPSTSNCATMRLRLCAERIAHGHFARAARGAQQQQRSHVDGAQDDQQAGHAHENDERLLQIDAAGRESLGIVQDLEVRVVEKVPS